MKLLTRLYLPLCIFLGAAPALLVGFSYLEGRFSVHTGNMLLIFLGLALAALLVFFALLVSIFIDILRARIPSAKILLFVTAVGCLIATRLLLPLPVKARLHGFRDNIASHFTPKQLHHIAATVRQQISKKEYIRYAGNPAYSSDPANTARWERLSQTIDLSALPPRYAIYHNGENVVISFGGILGHWNLHIDEKQIPLTQLDISTLPITDRICVSYSD